MSGTKKLQASDLLLATTERRHGTNDPEPASRVHTARLSENSVKGQEKATSEAQVRLGKPWHYI